MSAPQTHAATIQESLEEIASRAEAIYEKQYKQKYEKKNPGSYVVINIQNKKAYVGEFAEKLLQQARAEDQYGVFHLMRVGSPTTFKVSRWGNVDSIAGHYDKQGNACIKLHLYGAKHSAPGPEYIGIIDTGFTGFIQVPFSVAFALGIPLDGTNTFTLANGAKHVALMGLVVATFSGREEVGVAVLSTSPEILIGMDFLRRFQQALVVSQSGVFLVDENTIPISSWLTLPSFPGLLSNIHMTD